MRVKNLVSLVQWRERDSLLMWGQSGGVCSTQFSKGRIKVGTDQYSWNYLHLLGPLKTST
jgi:hypothetical protein